MPMFEYVCRACGERFEELRSRDPNQPAPVCPGCGSEEVVKLFSSFAAGAPAGGRAPGGPSCGGSGRFT